MNERAQQWWGKAKSDLAHARLSMDEAAHDWACLAAQQAAEKSLKAVPIEHDEGVPQVHDVSLLARKANAPKRIIQNGGLLTPFYTGTRYPDVDLTDDELAEAAGDAVSAAEEIREWCEKQI